MIRNFLKNSLKPKFLNSTPKYKITEFNDVTPLTEDEKAI